MKEYQNYLFDLYGTLVDVHTDEEKQTLWWQLHVLLAMDGPDCTASYLKEKYRAEVAARETQAKKARGAWAEIDIAPVFASFYEENGYCCTDEQIARLAKMFRLLSLEKLHIFPGAMQMLVRLKTAGKRVFLLSNAQSLFTMPELDALRLTPLFDGIVISSVEGLKKPDAQLYRRALSRYGLSAEETVMVGNDDRADCHGAAQVGLDSMYVCTEQSPWRSMPLPKNCRVLDNISQVYP